MKRREEGRMNENEHTHKEVSRVCGWKGEEEGEGQEQEEEEETKMNRKRSLSLARQGEKHTKQAT